MSEQPLLEVSQLSKKFEVKGGFFKRNREYIHAVNGVNLSLGKQETLGLVGESGSGKSTLGRLIMQLLPVDQGQVHFMGHELTNLNFKQLIHHRSAMQMIFQDPQDSLNARMSIGDIILEPLTIAKKLTPRERRIKLGELLQLVGLSEGIKDRYPHEFSGGQRQRIGIARALALSPKLIIADEPVSALDVSIQAQVLNLMKDLQEQLGISYLFIAHDIHVIFFISSQIAVMYLGEIMEQGPSASLREQPQHPYTRGLMDSVPFPNPERQQNFKGIEGEVPSLIHLPQGCKFHPRCPIAEEKCRLLAPKLEPCGEEGNHLVACHLAKR